MTNNRNLPGRQQGAALVVGLILLVVITILAISGMNTATTELAMARNDQTAENVFQAAERGLETALALVTCQACGQTLRPGLRLCLSCGKEAVQFSHAGDDERDRYEVQLVKAKEDVEYLARLRLFFELLGEQ